MIQLSHNKYHFIQTRAGGKGIFAIVCVMATPAAKRDLLAFSCAFAASSSLCVTKADTVRSNISPFFSRSDVNRWRLREEYQLIPIASGIKQTWWAWECRVDSLRRCERVQAPSGLPLKELVAMTTRQSSCDMVSTYQASVNNFEKCENRKRSLQEATNFNRCCVAVGDALSESTIRDLPTYSKVLRQRESTSRKTVLMPLACHH